MVKDVGEANTRIVTSLPCLSHHSLVLFGLSYEQLVPAPVVFPLPLGRPQIIHEITLDGPSPFPIPWYLDLIVPPEGPILSPTSQRMPPFPLY